ncbi:MAG: hypothetical protein ACOC5T_07700 [Elusimicrobiota bacterium]
MGELNRYVKRGHWSNLDNIPIYKKGGEIGSERDKGGMPDNQADSPTGTSAEPTSKPDEDEFEKSLIDYTKTMFINQGRDEAYNTAPPLCAIISIYRICYPKLKAQILKDLEETIAKRLFEKYSSYKDLAYCSKTWADLPNEETWIEETQMSRTQICSITRNGKDYWRKEAREILKED